MKRKIFIYIDAVLALILIIGIVLWVILKAEAIKLEQQVAAEENQLTIAEYEKTNSTINVSTPDEIKRIKAEIDQSERETDESLESIKAFVSEYIDIVYNTEGNFKTNKDKIIAAAESYVTKGFKEYLFDKIFYISEYNNLYMLNKTKRIDNFCTPDDVYITVQKDENDMNMYYALSALHCEDKTVYRDIVVTEVDGKLLISSDSPVNPFRM